MTLKKDYADVFEGLGCLPGKHKIKVDPEIHPIVNPPKRIPLAIRDKVKSELERMKKFGVIEKHIEPTPWVSDMATALKSNGKMRLCIDPQHLNKAILGEHYSMKTIEDVILQIPEAKIFTKLDATSGYWQIQLDDDSKKLRTFNTPYGRYSFTRLPFWNGVVGWCDGAG